MIQQRITQYIEKNHLFSSDSKILVALSGGADSVALLRILHTAGYHCEAAHCNFHLRGEESNRDESFVRQLCLKYNIRLHTADFNTTQYAAEKHISIEMAARELRYNWFEEIKNKYLENNPQLKELRIILNKENKLDFSDGAYVKRNSNKGSMPTLLSYK